MANPNDEVHIIISAEDKASGVFSNVNKGLQNLGGEASRALGPIEMLQGSWVRMAAVMAPIAGLAGGIVASLMKTADVAEELNKMSKQTGISVENLSGLKFAAELSETSIEALNKGMGFFSKALHGANEEGKDTTQILRALGITAKDPYEALLQTADAFARMEAGADKSFLAMQLFGRGGKDMIPMLIEGAEGIRNMQNEAKDLGIIISTKLAQESDQFNDNIHRMEASLSSFAKMIGGFMIPKLNEMFDLLSGKKDMDLLLGGLIEKRAGLDKQISALSETFTQRGLLEDIKKERELVQKQIDGVLNAMQGSATTHAVAKSAAPKIIDPEAIKKASEEANKAIIDSWELQDRINKTREAAIIADWELEDRLNKQRESEIMADWELTQRIQDAKKAKAQELADWQIMQWEREQEKFQERFDRISDLIQQERDMRIQAYQDAWQKQFDMANSVGGELGAGLGMMMAGMKGITDMQQGVDPYSQEYERTAQHYANMMQLKIDHYGTSTNIDAEWQAIMQAQEQMAAQQRVATYQNMAGAMAGTMYSLYVAAGQNSNAMFGLYKTFAVTEALISTYAGAARALKDFPYPFSIAVAGLVTAAGMARVAAIMSQKPGGSATAATPSGGGGYSYNQPTTPSYQPITPAAETQQPKVTNIHIYGNVVDHDKFARELVESIKKAEADGAH